MKTKGGKYFPDYIVSRPIWILWRLEEDQKGRLTKVPYSAKYNGRASSKKPRQWSTYNEAVRKLIKSNGYYGGVGICIQPEDRLIFIDIDHCINEDGEMNGIAKDILSQMNTQFVEISQSGTGIHILALGDIPRSFKNSKTGVEMYRSARPASLTGNAIYENEPHEAAEAINYVFSKYKTDDPEPAARMPTSDPCRSDQWVLDHARRQRKFELLYSGSLGFLNYGSQSEADLALCSMLAFWTDCDADQIDRIFRMSGLYRDKWERNKYRDWTINKAIRNCHKTFSEYLREVR